MALELHDLNDETRQYMLEELDRDEEQDDLYEGKYLNETGRNDYPGLIRQAIQQHNDEWLADQLRDSGRLKTHTERRKPSGGTTTVKVPVTAPEMLAEGEFNRFYARGLCRRAIANDVENLVVYRAKAVRSPRSASEAMLGQEVSAQALLDDLRSSQGVEPALGLPPGPNSGLSVKLP